MPGGRRRRAEQRGHRRCICHSLSGERLCGSLPVLTAGREKEREVREGGGGGGAEKNKWRRRNGREKREHDGDRREEGEGSINISTSQRKKKNSNITFLPVHNIAEVAKEINDSVTDKQRKAVTEQQQESSVIFPPDKKLPTYLPTYLKDDSRDEAEGMPGCRVDTRGTHGGEEFYTNGTSTMTRCSPIALDRSPLETEWKQV
ncbi:uncharacterized protein V6R79_011185 [Siganus canaliculatus]